MAVDAGSRAPLSIRKACPCDRRGFYTITEASFNEFEAENILHLAMDAYGVDDETLADERLVETFLDRCPGDIGMTKIAAPQVYTYRGREPKD